jgi:hypothetical protein
MKINTRNLTVNVKNVKNIKAQYLLVEDEHGNEYLEVVLADAIPQIPVNVITSLPQTQSVTVETPKIESKPVAEKPKIAPVAEKPVVESKPMSNDAAELKAEIVKLGGKKQGLHLCGIDTLKNKLAELRKEKGIVEDKPAPFTRPVESKPAAKNNNGFKGKSGGGFKGKGKGKEMEIVIMPVGDLKPIRVMKADGSAELPNGKTVKSLFYTDESVEENGVKVYSPQREQDQVGVADNYVKCAAWFVKSDNIIEM